MKMIGTESEIKDIYLALSFQNEYCPIMQWTKPGETLIDFGCKGVNCNTMQQVYGCLIKRVEVEIIK